MFSDLFKKLWKHGITKNYGNIMKLRKTVETLWNYEKQFQVQFAVEITQ